MKFAIIVGHEDDREGAAMAAPYEFISEYEFNTVLAGVLKALAPSRGMDAGVFLRDHVGIQGAYDAAKNSGAVCCVELHYNSADRPASGTETFFGGQPGSELLAGNIHFCLCGIYNREGLSRGYRKLQPKENGYPNVNAISIPSVLVEPFFGCNRVECEYSLLRIPEIARAILQGISQWARGVQVDFKTILPG